MDHNPDITGDLQPVDHTYTDTGDLQQPDNHTYTDTGDLQPDNHTDNDIPKKKARKAAEGDALPDVTDIADHIHSVLSRLTSLRRAATDAADAYQKGIAEASTDGFITGELLRKFGHEAPVRRGRSTRKTPARAK